MHNTEWISVSPDGEQIALVLTTDPGPWERGEPLIELGLYLYDRKSGKVGLIMEHATQPAWSPDGGRIAYRSGGNLWVMDLETGNSSELYQADTENEHYVDALEWSPDGRTLLFIDKVFRQETILKTVDVATGEVLIEVEHPFYFLYQPQWSPDGSGILYTTTDGKTSTSQRFSNLWIVDSNGANKSQITQEIQVYSQPHWSPDGKWIAFAGAIGYETVDSEYDLWIVNPSESRLMRLTATQELTELSPVWSLGCTSIYFLVNDELKQFSLSDGSEKEVLAAKGNFVISK